jgi:hypothetical protein
MLARDNGETEASIRANDAHTRMDLTDSCPAVRNILGGDFSADVDEVKLLEKNRVQRKAPTIQTAAKGRN